jgi:hypothetical protein
VCSDDGGECGGDGDGFNFDSDALHECDDRSEPANQCVCGVMIPSLFLWSFEFAEQGVLDLNITLENLSSSVAHNASIQIIVITDTQIESLQKHRPC